MTGHKIETEKVNGGIVAVCSDWGCAWKGVRVIRKTNAVTGEVTEVNDQVFPNRAEAVASFKAFHA